jgi:putative oxidoreductase
MVRKLSALPPLAARACLGAVFLASGWGKLHDLPRVVDYFASLGIPAPGIQAPFVSGVELVGGALLLAGLFTRLASLPLAATMVVALLTAKRPEIAGLSDLFGTSEFLYLLLLGLLAATGAGALSVDALVDFLRARETRSPSPASRDQVATSSL